MRGDRGVIGPDAYAGIVQRAPREKRARIDFALRRDVAMSDDSHRWDVVAGDDIAREFDERVDLLWRIRLPLSVADGPEIHVLDADRRCVQFGYTLLVTDAGVPDALVFGHELEDHGFAVLDARIVGDDVVDTHLVARQHRERAGLVDLRVGITRKRMRESAFLALCCMSA